MFPARDVGRAVGALPVADGEIDDFPVQFCRAEDQVKISKGIEVAEIRAVCRDCLVIFAPEDFRAAQCIFDGLTKHP